MKRLGDCSFIFVLLLLLIASLSGCATNAVTGRSQLMLVSEQSAISKSAGAYSSLISGLSKSGKLSTDKELNDRIQRITNNLITKAVKYRPSAKDWQWSINVIDDKEIVNAWCMAGGKMAIYTGLISKLEPTDDELAQILGHEISHALSNHTAEKLSMQIASQLAVATVTALAKPRHQQAANNIYALAAETIISLPNSRETEYEADKIGIQLAAQAGYHPHAAVTLWEKMMRAAGKRSKFEFLSTHPASENRLEALAELEKVHFSIYESNKEERTPSPISWASMAKNTSSTTLFATKESISGSSNSFTAQRLREISKLKAEGVITEIDFLNKKKQLLDEY